MQAPITILRPVSMEEIFSHFESLRRLLPIFHGMDIPQNRMKFLIPENYPIDLDRFMLDFEEVDLQPSIDNPGYEVLSGTVEDQQRAEVLKAFFGIAS